MSRVNVWFDSRSSNKRTQSNWCVTIYNGSSSRTERFETEGEARDRAAVLQENTRGEVRR